MKSIFRLSAFALGLSCLSAAHAEVQFNGFGQIYAGSSFDENDTIPTTTYDDDVSFESESLLALQASAPISERVSATAQIIARGREEWDTSFAWAYLRAQLTDSISVKAGRQRTPLFRYSDFLEVGAAYPWVRPPESVYNSPSNNFNGVLVAHNTFKGDWYLQTQLLAGNDDTDATTPGDGRGRVTVGFDNLLGVTFDASYNDWMSLRASYFSMDLSTSVEALDPVIDGIETTSGPEAASDVASDGDKAAFSSVSLEFNRSGWMLGAELTKFDTDESYVADQTQWYVSGAKTLGKWTPYVVYGERDNESDGNVTKLPESDPYYPTVQAIIAGQAEMDNFTSVGLRYSVTPTLSLKADWTMFSSDLEGIEDADRLTAGVAFTF